MVQLLLLLTACADQTTVQPTPTTSPAFTARPNFTPIPILPPAPTATPLANGPHQPNPAFLRWGYYLPDDPDSQASLKANLGSLDVVSPAYFIINADGEVRGSDHPTDSALIQSKGVKLVPMVQNNPLWDKLHTFLADPTWLDKTTAKLEDVVNRYHYDGLQIDLEAINTTDREAVTDFMSRLYARLHSKGKLVTMAVGSRVADVPSKFGGAYDYKALGNYLDYVTIMTYDFSGPSSDPGPIAPIEWVSTVAEYAASQFGPRKVLLGIPFYGYEWNTSQNKYVRARGYPSILDIVSKNNGETGYDNIYQSPYAQFTQGGDTYQIWFENERSLAAKFDLVTSLKLGGFAAWRLGLEGPPIWSLINSTAPPTARQTQSSPAAVGGQYFPETGHLLSPTFKSYWEQHGGAKVLGLPLTDEITETEPGSGPLRVQYFQNARLEYHPENKNTPTEVMPAALGRELTSTRKNEPAFGPSTSNVATLPACGTGKPSDTICFSPQTGQSMANGFKAFWEDNGGLPVFGLAISQEFAEPNPFDGKTYTVQYFERSRLQYDPVTRQISVGALGAQSLWQRGWLR